MSNTYCLCENTKTDDKGCCMRCGIGKESKVGAIALPVLIIVGLFYLGIHEETKHHKENKPTSIPLECSQPVNIKV